MTIVTLAHGARQSLARGLEALQAVDAPAGLMDVAQPVARAMGVLAELERAPEGWGPARVEPALEALREGLRLLQLPEHVDHPAAARGMVAVAETLGTVVELARCLEVPAPRAAEPARGRTLTPVPLKPAVQTLAPARPNTGPAVVTGLLNRVVAAPGHAPAPALAPAPARPSPERPITGVAERPQAAASAPAVAQKPVVASTPAVPQKPAASAAPLAKAPPAPQAMAVAKPAAAQLARAAAQQRNDPPRTAAAPAVRRDVVIDPGLRAVDAELGTHGANNFYVGIAGDVLTSGGLFVGTYQVPDVNERVLLKISMPGGYELIAIGVVEWTRGEGSPSTGPKSMRGPAGPPGFGARLVEISEEGQRLVQRYVKNREPLFYDP